MAVQTGIEHFAIAARNTDALADFYVKTFGFSVAYKNAKTPATYFVKPPRAGSMIEIVPANEKPAVRRDLFDPGLVHVALSVTDLAATMKELAGKGITFEGDVKVSGDVKAVFFRDPEGNILHLIERPKPL
ncbi:MAG: VOC family protein [Phycisphaerae bacterium]|nr:VOC family protein [Phycisphaerae bacterium]